MVTAAIVIATLLAGAVWILWPAPEPVYQGKPLSYWLDDLARVRFSTLPDPRSTNAVMQSGTNLIPTLLRLLNARDYFGTDKLYSALLHLPWVRFEFQTAWWKQNLARAGFEALGPLGSDAVPELIRLYERQPHNPSTRLEIAHIFGYIGKSAAQATPYLVADLLTDPDVLQRCVCAHALGNIRAHPESSIPALLNALSSSDNTLKARAAGSLGKFHEQPDIVIPALIAAQANANEEVGSNVAEALGNFGPVASAALPILKRMMRDAEHPSTVFAAYQYIHANEAIAKISPSNSELCDFPH